MRRLVNLQKYRSRRSATFKNRPVKLRKLLKLTKLTTMMERRRRILMCRRMMMVLERSSDHISSMVVTGVIGLAHFSWYHGVAVFMV